MLLIVDELIPGEIVTGELLLPLINPVVIELMLPLPEIIFFTLRVSDESEELFFESAIKIDDGENDEEPDKLASDRPTILLSMTLFDSPLLMLSDLSSIINCDEMAPPTEDSVIESEPMWLSFVAELISKRFGTNTDVFVLVVGSINAIPFEPK